MKPMTMTVTQVARMLDAPETFVGKLSAHRMLPQPDADGSYRVAAIQHARAIRPWLRELGTPMCSSEIAGIDPRLRIPDGMGFMLADQRYARLWEVMDHALT